MTEFERQMMMDNEIDIRQLFRIIVKRMKWIVLITMLAVIISAGVSFYFLTPIYEASTTIMVNKTYSDNEIITQLQLNDLNLNMRLAETYSEIIKSRRVVTEVIEQMDLDFTYEELTRITDVSLVKNTEFINIKVTNSDPVLARDIANTLAEVFQIEVVEIMKVDNVQVLDASILPTQPIKPNKTLNVAIAGVLGLMLSLGLVFLLEFLDRTLKSPDDVKLHLNLNVIGAIPFSGKDHDRQVITYDDPKSPISEAYRTLRTNIQFASLDAPIKTMVITSAIAGEGKSTTIFNLATTLAQMGEKVLLIDADFRKPMLHKVAEMANNYGLTNILIRDSDYKESIKKSHIENLDLIFSGVIPPNPSELLNSKKMKKFIDTVKEDYDYVLFDTPPVGLVTDAAILSTNVDGAILVTAVGQVDFDVAKRAVQLLRNVQANLIGSVLNKIPIGDKTYSYYYYSSYYGELTHNKKRRKGA